ncbi:MAG: Trm112 family protein [Gemmatimonadaceae bacterium]
MGSPIPAAIRELLVCPKCRGRLDDAPATDALHCAACSLSYPVRDGIPVMLIDQATSIRS